MENGNVDMKALAPVQSAHAGEHQRQSCVRGEGFLRLGFGNQIEIFESLGKSINTFGRFVVGHEGYLDLYRLPGLHDDFNFPDRIMDSKRLKNCRRDFIAHYQPAVFGVWPAIALHFLTSNGELK